MASQKGLHMACKGQRFSFLSQVEQGRVIDLLLARLGLEIEQLGNQEVRLTPVNIGRIKPMPITDEW